MILAVSASIKSRASARAGATPVKDPARAAPAAAASAQKRDGFCRKGTICGPVFRFRNSDRVPKRRWRVLPNRVRERKGAGGTFARPVRCAANDQASQQMLKKAP